MNHNLLLKDHEAALKKNVFFTHNKWPHFNLIFEDIKKISKRLKKNSNILSLERTSLYGGISLFAPFFYKHNFTSIDCSSKKILKRGDYNSKYVINRKIIRKKLDFQSSYKDILKLKIKKKHFDYILIPNLLHHIFDYELLFKNCKKLLKKRGKLYIFEPLLRELHQKPDDYFRFTPYSLEMTLKKMKFKNFNVRYSGGAFTATSYCWDQALQYIPKNKRKKLEKYVNFKKILELESKYKKNLSRKFTSFPVSFSLTSDND